MKTYKHDQHTLAIRAWELRKAGKTEAEIAQELTDELSREATGYTVAQIRSAVAQAEELYAAHVFVARHPEWLEIATPENIDLLERTAKEFSNPYDLGALESAYYDLLETNGFEKPAPEAEPETEPQPVPAQGAPHVQKSGATGTLTPTGSPEELARLRAMPLKDLKTLQAQQRWERLRATGRDRALRDEKIVI